MADEITIRNGLRFRSRVEVVAVSPCRQLILMTLNGWNGRVELPGGGVDEGENIYQAAERETMEEAGWTITDTMSMKHRSKWSTFQGKDSPWLAEQGFDGEDQYMVFAFAKQFSPTELYKGEGDGHHFGLYGIEHLTKQIAEDIFYFENQIGGSKVTRHLYTQAQFRAELLALQYPDILSRIKQHMTALSRSFNQEENLLKSW